MKGPVMMMNTTLDQLRQLKLVSMAQALQEQMQQSGISAMSFEERLAMLVDREVHGRQDRRCAKLLKTARLKYPQAMIEDLDCRPSRGIDRATVMSLTLGPWVRGGHAVLITGPTGAGKSWLGCALAQHACRQGHSAFYQRVPRLAEELRIRHANGTFTRWLDVLKNTDVLVLDDWGLVGMDAQTRTDLLEMIDDRAGRKATIITSQLPIEHWRQPKKAENGKIDDTKSVFKGTPCGPYAATFGSAPVFSRLGRWQADPRSTWFLGDSALLLHRTNSSAVRPSLLPVARSRRKAPHA